VIEDKSRRRPVRQRSGRPQRFMLHPGPVENTPGLDGDEGDGSRCVAVWVATSVEDTELGPVTQGRLITDPDAVDRYLKTGIIPPAE
jgi:hypothetical protein